MLKLLIVAAITVATWLPATSQAQGTLARISSPYSFAETVQRIEKTIAARGLTMFAKIDHSAAASASGLTLRPTLLLIFGNPKGGTPIMQAEPGAGIDLPLKALVWEDDDKQVNVTVNTGALYRRHGLSEEQVEPVSGSIALVQAALE